MKKAMSLLLAVLMVFTMLAGCGGDTPETQNPAPGQSAGTETSSPAPGGSSEESLINFDEEPYEVSIQFVGLFEANNNIANVEAALNEITLEKINVTVDIVPVFIGELPTTTSLGVAGDEKLDIVTVGLTSPISTMVGDELLLPLDDLLAERGQAAVAVTANVAEAQKINGVTYGVSGYAYAGMATGFVYNKTMADKYGIEMHDEMTDEELTAVAEILKQNGIYLTTFGNSDEVNYKFHKGGEFYGTAGAFGGILDPARSTTVENVFDTQAMRDYWKLTKSWADAGYLPSDQLTDTTSTQEYFSQQVIFGTATGYTPDQIAVWLNPNFETGIIRLTTPCATTGIVAEFMLGIAANCERPDKAMDLINLIYSDPAVANLLQYGVEGTDYLAVEGTENVITYTGSANEDHNSYYSPFVRFGDPMDRKIVSPLTDSYYEELKAFDAASEISLSIGYSFDSKDFGAEAGAISSILQQKLPMLNAGMVDDVDKAVDDLVASLEAAGINDVIAANQAQLDAFLGK